MKQFNVPAFLVNTGWVGASASSGAKRIPLPLTRKIIDAILEGTILKVEFEPDPYFGVQVPKSLPGIESDFLIPAKRWNDTETYSLKAKELVKKFQDNFQQYDVESASVREAGPTIS
jgi:phosphoenolpyruvate carboxykinase (ATP)